MKRPEHILDLEFDKEITEGIQMAIVEEANRSLVIIQFSNYPNSFLIFEKNEESVLKVDDFLTKIRIEYTKLQAFGWNPDLMTANQVSEYVFKWSHPQLDFL